MVPPQPGSAVYRAVDEQRDRALCFDRMERRVPVGLGRDGLPVYDSADPVTGLHFTCPPFAAVLMVPLALLPTWLAAVLWTTASVAALAAVVVVVRRSAASLGWAPAPAATALLVVVLLALDPIHTTVNLGQINVVLLALVLVDLTYRPGRWQGVGVGLAAAVKLTPLLFVGYLLLTGRRRAAATAAAPS